MASSTKEITEFVKCSKTIESKTKINFDICQKHIKRHCPTRFGSNFGKHILCRTLLWEVRIHGSDYKINMSRLNLYISNVVIRENRTQLLTSFLNYHKCMLNFTIRLSPCISGLESLCKSSKIRAVKTVRATMDSANTLMDINQNVKVFHLLCDPRAVSLSRLKQPSFRGRHSGYNKTREAAMYCQRAVCDIYMRNKLAYPNTYEVIFDEFAVNPVN